MLLGPLPALTTAKLDISLLLEASPTASPTSSNSSQLAGAGASLHGGPITRSTSVPAFSSQGASGLDSHRNSISSTISSATTSNLVRTTSSQYFFTGVPTELQSSQMSVQQQPRPVLPPLVTTPLLTHQQLSPQPLHHQSHFLHPHQQALLPGPIHPPAKRHRPNSPLTAPSPAKRQSKWTAEEDAIIIELRGSGMKWEDISKRLPGRSAISCRLHYQNYLERRSEWDEEKKNRLARLYERLKPEMWAPLAAELSIPWRAAEAMHWQLGEADMARRAGVVPFSLAASSQPSSANTPPSVGPSMQTQTGGLYHSGPTQGPGMIGGGYGGYPGPGDLGCRRDIVGSLHEHRHEAPPSIRRPDITLSDVQPSSSSSHQILPSMSELERGLTVAAASERRFPDYRRR